MTALNEDQRAVLALWYVTNASLTSYYKLVNVFSTPKNALSAKLSAWQALTIHKSHLERWADTVTLERFLDKTEQRWQNGEFGLLFLGDDEYPETLAHLYDPPPVLFYMGDVKKLNQKQLAIVGTRNPSEYAKKITFDLAQYLVQAGFVITSGLAIGVDNFAHQGALSQSAPEYFGCTVGVMGTGIDVCYPKQNQALFKRIVQEGGCLVSELLPETPALKHNFPRRNRLVTGLSLATIVTEAAMQSGSLLSARLASEQGRQVFAIPGQIDNINAEGCHHLIREGATLIYHPRQILEELNLQITPMLMTISQTTLEDDRFEVWTSQAVKADDESLKKPQKNPTTPTDAPKNLPEPVIDERLLPCFSALGDEWMDLDGLMIKSGLGIDGLLSGLIELEILGVAEQSGGLYRRTSE